MAQEARLPAHMHIHAQHYGGQICLKSMYACCSSVWLSYKSACSADMKSSGVPHVSQSWHNHYELAINMCFDM